MSKIEGNTLQKSELDFFKDILKNRKIQILKNLGGLYDELDKLHLCELKDDVDYISVNNSAIVESTIVEKQQEELREIEAALVKINLGTYGACEMCGEDIGFQRLKVKPHALYCIHCKTILDKTNK